MPPRWDASEEITADLQRLASDLEAPVLALATLTKTITSREPQCIRRSGPKEFPESSDSDQLDSVGIDGQG